MEATNCSPCFKKSNTCLAIDVHKLVLVYSQSSLHGTMPSIACFGCDELSVSVGRSYFRCFRLLPPLSIGALRNTIDNHISILVRMYSKLMYDVQCALDDWNDI